MTYRVILIENSLDKKLLYKTLEKEIRSLAWDYFEADFPLPMTLTTGLDLEKATHLKKEIKSAGGKAIIDEDAPCIDKIVPKEIDVTKDKYLSKEEVAIELSRIFGFPFYVLNEGNVIKGETGRGLMFRAYRFLDVSSKPDSFYKKKEEYALGYFEGDLKIFNNLFGYHFEKRDGEKDGYDDINLTLSHRQRNVDRISKEEEGISFLILDGGVYCGGVKDGLPHGYGTITGTKVHTIGQYCHGVKNGFFITCKKNGIELTDVEACIYDNGIPRPDLLFAQLGIKKVDVYRDWDQ